MADREEYPVITCQICGVTQQATYSEPTKSNMVERQLCFHCLFWTELLEADRTDMFVAEGHHYHIGPEEGGGPGGIRARGYGGRKHFVQFKDGRRVTTTNLWHQGEVPKRFRDKFPDDATLEMP